MFIYGSVIEKCLHGVYLATPEEKRFNRARYCGFCSPDIYIRDAAVKWDPKLMQTLPTLEAEC
jgi:hypothetical protein